MTCKVCGKRAYSEYCVQHKPRKPIQARRRPNRVSTKQQDYLEWLKAVARPYLILMFGNVCACCGRPAKSGEKLDIDHIEGKGAHPEKKRDLSNLQLLCRWPCHRNKTDGVECAHGD